MKNDPRVKVILGGPGCGKTTRLIEIVQQEIDDGIHPSRIAFVAFTKAAATEAQERAAAAFGINAKSNLPWFRTIHSLAYALLGLQRDEVMSFRDWKEFGEVVGEQITGRYEIDVTGMSSGSLGDRMLRIIDFARSTKTRTEDAWHDLGEDVDWWRLKRFEDAYSDYKDKSGKVDFADMLEMYYNTGEPIPVDVAIIDESQDLTAAQWSVVKKAFKNVKRIYIGGDDDQAIFKWAGADVNYFLNLTDTPEVLSHSFRLPVSIFNLSQHIAKRIQKRYSKSFSSRDEEGSISFHMQPSGIDLTNGSWLMIARNGYMLYELRDIVRDYGVNYYLRDKPAIDPLEVEMMYLWERLRNGKESDVSASNARTLCKLLGMSKPALKETIRYTPQELNFPIERIWHEAFEGIDFEDREFYISCLRRGENLREDPRIRINTIHSVKGAEADNVLLMTDMSSKTAAGYESSPDNEHRVFYVAVTRAKNSLHVIQPQTDIYYQL